MDMCVIERRRITVVVIRRFLRPLLFLGCAKSRVVRCVTVDFEPLVEDTYVCRVFHLRFGTREFVVEGIIDGPNTLLFVTWGDIVLTNTLDDRGRAVQIRVGSHIPGEPGALRGDRAVRVPRPIEIGVQV